MVEKDNKLRKITGKMAFIQCNFYSEILGRGCAMNVILPEVANVQFGWKSQGQQGKLKVVYLLHGMSDDQTIWMRRTSIERYATEHAVAVVMPDAQRSFYVNMAHGGRFGDFFATELIAKVESLFQVSTSPKDRYVAGLSMGGYGALKLLLDYPDKFKAAAALSMVADITMFSKLLEDDAWKREMEDIFGDLSKLKDSEYDLFALSKKLEQQDSKVNIYQFCGTEDFLYAGNVALRDAMRRNPKINLNYCESPGEHSWALWDEQIKAVLKYFMTI